jgi:hypothetical protein
MAETQMARPRKELGQASLDSNSSIHQSGNHKILTLIYQIREQ